MSGSRSRNCTDVPRRPQSSSRFEGRPSATFCCPRRREYQSKRRLPVISVNEQTSPPHICLRSSQSTRTQGNDMCGDSRHRP
jgi:hypothetical protein